MRCEQCGGEVAKRDRFTKACRHCNTSFERDNSQVSQEDEAAEFDFSFKKHQHELKGFTDSGLNEAFCDKVNEMLPTCPFCKRSSRWLMQSSSLSKYRCAHCIALIVIKKTYFTSRVKRVYFKERGIALNDVQLGRQCLSILTKK